MAHYQQLQFVRELSVGLPDYFTNSKVLEIGSWDVNGSIRNFFKDCDYLGVDIAEGPGVDLVSKGEDISLPDVYFDVVVSCECFEHNVEWVRTFKNMIRMLKPGGLCIVTCATLGRSEHGTKRTNADASLTALNNFPDYYKNLAPKDFRRNVDLNNGFESYRFFLNAYSKDLYFMGIKKKTTGEAMQSICPDIITRIKNIRREKHVSFISSLRHRLKFLYRYSLASVLGEGNYHDLKYRINKK